MKKIIIGAIVAAILFFVWQTLSWAVLNLHNSYSQYTPKQDTLLSVLQSRIKEDGQYLLPRLPDGASMDDYKKYGEKVNGKPWAIVAYHSAYNVNMGANMGRGFVVNIVIMLLFCWIISRLNSPQFGTIFFASVFTGIIAFLSQTYTLHIWYETPGIKIDFLDALVSWGIVGIWLGWYMRKK
jgi:hypothetical protein